MCRTLNLRKILGKTKRTNKLPKTLASTICATADGLKRPPDQWEPDVGLELGETWTQRTKSLDLFQRTKALTQKRSDGATFHAVA